MNRGPAGRRLSSSAAAHGSRQRKGRTAQGSWLMLGWELKMQGMVLFPSSLFLSFFTPRVFLVLLCLLLALPSGRIPIWPSLYGGRAETQTQIQKSVALLKVRRQNTPLSQGLSAKPPLPMHVFFSPALLRSRLQASRFPVPPVGLRGMCSSPCSSPSRAWAWVGQGWLVRERARILLLFVVFALATYNKRYTS